jgi:hypothetical protein
MGVHEVVDAPRLVYERGYLQSFEGSDEGLEEISPLEHCLGYCCWHFGKYFSYFSLAFFKNSLSLNM